MVTKKSANTTVKDVVLGKDPAKFDVAGWLKDLSERGFKPRNVTVKLHLRGELLPRINELIQKIQSEGEIERVVGMNDADPMAEMVAEYERLSAEFAEGGHVDFTFRPMTKTMHNATFREWQKDHPNSDNLSDTDDAWDELARLRMAATCIDFPGKGGAIGDEITVEALRAFEDAYGTPAFNTLVRGWDEAYLAGGEVTAPFSPKPSPTPDTAG